MEDKTISMAEIFVTVKRLELLTQEMIYQTILSRTINKDDAEKEYKESMKTVFDNLEASLKGLSPSE